MTQRDLVLALAIMGSAGVSTLEQASPPIPLPDGTLAILRCEEAKGSHVRISLIVVASRSTADDVLAKLRAGASFAALAKEFSTHASQSAGGALPVTEVTQLRPEFQAALKQPGACPEYKSAAARAGMKLAVTEVGPALIRPDVFPRSIAVSPDRRKVYYLSGRPMGQVFGAEGSLETGDLLHTKYVPGALGGAFSPDGSRVAVMKQFGKSRGVEVDGMPPPLFVDLGQEGPRFAADGKRLAYAGLAAGGWVYVVDGEASPTYERVGSSTFSPDGRRFAFSAFRGGTWRVVLDARETAEFDAVSTLTFSPDSRRFAFWGRRAAAWFMVLDGNEIGPYDRAVEPGPVFSPDSKRLAYVAARNNRPILVIDAKETVTADGFASVTFSPDGQRLAAYLFVRGKVRVLLDGVEGREYDGAVGGIAFSPNSRRVAYGVKRDGRAVMVVDAVESAAFDDIEQPGPVFAPDNRRVAWSAKREGEATLVLDGLDTEITYTGLFATASIVFDSPSRLHLLVVPKRGGVSSVSRLDIAIGTPAGLAATFASVPARRRDR